jgi:DNA-binding transcriptional LysR family regulator
MTDRSLSLTPDALLMMDTIARTGSFAAAARELGKVPSALTYSVRQLEDALDVLLFDRRSRQARFTAAGEELLEEGRRLLTELDAVANRVRRVATGWEGHLTVVADDVIDRRTLFELCEAFHALDPQGLNGPAGQGGPGTRLRLRTEVMSGTWEALINGQADLAIGVGSGIEPPPGGVATAPLGTMPFVFAVAPHHPLAGHAGPIADHELLRYRAVAVADSAQRLSPRTVNLLPGQEVLTVSTMVDKVEALRRGMGCGFVPAHLVRPLVAAGELLVKPTQRPDNRPTMSYAWRCTIGPKGSRRPPPGLALQWWLKQLTSPTTRQALLGEAG